MSMSSGGATMNIIQLCLSLRGITTSPPALLSIPV